MVDLPSGFREVYLKAFPGFEGWYIDPRAIVQEDAFMQLVPQGLSRSISRA